MQKLEEHNKRDDVYLSKMSAYKGVMYLARGMGNALCYLFVVAKASMGAFGVGSIVQYVGAFTELIQNVGMLTWFYFDNEVYCGHLEKLYEYCRIARKILQRTCWL